MGIGSNRVALAAISAVIDLVAGLASATETLAAHWQVHRPPTPTPASYTGEQYFSAASCPAPGGCLLAGEPNLLASSSDPTADGSWSFAQPVEVRPCEDNPKRCEVPLVELPPGFPVPLKPWQQRTNTDISCPSAGFCAVSTLDGSILGSVPGTDFDRLVAVLGG